MAVKPRSPAKICISSWFLLTPVPTLDADARNHLHHHDLCVPCCWRLALTWTAILASNTREAAPHLDTLRAPDAAMWFGVSFLMRSNIHAKDAFQTSPDLCSSLHPDSDFVDQHAPHLLRQAERANP